MRRAQALLQLIVTTVAIHGVQCDQPRPACTTARGSFAAAFHLKEGSGECSTRPGEILGVQPYFRASSGGGNLDFSLPGRVAIQSSRMSELADTARKLDIPLPDAPLYSLGTFDDAEADDDDVCIVSELSAVERKFPEVNDGEEVVLPALTLSYAWSNVRVPVSAAHPGTQFRADLTLRENGCSATYDVWALWPAIACKGDDGRPQDELCFSARSEEGYKLPPDAMVRCDETLFVCVPRQAPPSFTEGQ